MYPGLLADEEFKEERSVAHLQGKKAHLLFLMPLFAECISCREQELKDNLKDIFFMISKELGISGQFSTFTGQNPLSRKHFFDHAHSPRN